MFWTFLTTKEGEIRKSGNPNQIYPALLPPWQNIGQKFGWVWYPAKVG